MAHKLPIISGGEDETGLISLVQPWWAETLAECFTVGEGGGGRGPLIGLNYRSREFGLWDKDTQSNGFQIGLTYTGILAERADSDNEGELDMELSDKSIDTISILAQLKKEFGATVDAKGHVKFPEKLPGGAGAGGAGGFAVASGADAARNPMFGQTTYPYFGSTYTRRYSRKKVPADLLKRIGKIYKTPPGLPAYLTPPGRDWLFDLPTLSFGRDWAKIGERFKLSPPGGWPPHITMLYQSNFAAA